MKLGKDFYLQPAIECAPDFLGKKLVHETKAGRLSGIIYDVEAYPGFTDEVHHGNKRTERTEIMFRDGGYAYVYLIYGTWYQFAAVVNKDSIPDVVFIRAVIPIEGIEIMKNNFGRNVKDDILLTNSPGKLCRSFGITKDLYGVDLTANGFRLEDVDIKISLNDIQKSKRIGISQKLKGADAELRFWIPPELLEAKYGEILS